MSDLQNDTLIEAAASVYRERDSRGRILSSPAWRDLSVEDRAIAFDLQVQSRVMERLLDPRGRSATVRAVLQRLRRMPAD